MNSKLLKHLLSLSLPLAAAQAVHAGGTTTIGSFSGGDEGEGLDLQGVFVYAVNIGTPGEVGQAGDAYFTADNVDGFTINAVNQIPNWHAPNYGDSPDDDAIERVMQSIRWSPSPSVVRMQMDNLVAGSTYKVQLLFAEQCCAGRGFNITANGELIAPNFLPAAIQGGAGVKTQGAVVSYEFVATGTSLEVILDGAAATASEISDHNAIINGLTLERTASPGDLDGDGLVDAWELLFFGNLDQKASGDPDNDGLTNEQEFAANSNPTKADSDGDGLSDGDEVKLYKSNPTKKDSDGDGLTDFDEVKTTHTNPNAADSDGDGLSDAVEVNASHTDPNKADTDGDGYNDLQEYYTGTDAGDKLLFPRGILVNRFTGGDPGEGLDLDGVFPYAFGVGPGSVPPGLAGSANFTVDSDPGSGINIVAANNILDWFGANFGTSDADKVVGAAVHSIRWANAATASPQVKVNLDNLVPGTRYKVQLLFAEGCCSGRAFDVFVRSQEPANPFDPFDPNIDRMLAHELNPAAIQGGAGNRTAGAVVSYEFTAHDTVLRVVLDGRGVTNPLFTDHNAILNAVTLEDLSTEPDTDHDGLPDAWEIANFGNLKQDGAGDPDKDGVNNALEFELSLDPNSADTDHDGISDFDELNVTFTDPTNPDSDRDGLKDGAELSRGTNPLNTDSDADGLSDGNEVNVYHTDPAVADTDGDGVLDGAEVEFGMNPLVADATEFTNTQTLSFTGGDADEGLDLDGTFIYALNIGTPGAVGLIRDANFTADNVAGAKVTAVNEIASWFPAEYGDTDNDNNLEKVMRSMRWSAAPSKPKVELANLIPGASYRLQLLFGEECCNRGFDVLVDGILVADEFSPPLVHNGKANHAEGAVVVTDFVAKRDKVTVILDGNGITTASINDHNPIINGLTLEQLALPIQIGKITTSKDGVSITFNSIAGQNYQLQYRADLTKGAWETLAEVVSATGASTVITDKVPAHSAGGQGYWRVISAQ